MNVLFLSLGDFSDINEPGIYTDLLREFVKHGHFVYAVSPCERRTGQESHLIEGDHTRILKLRVGNIQKTNVLEKGISTLTIEGIILSGIKRYFSGVKFDLVLYSTPPITLCNAVRFIKKRDNAKTYLLLKDIFPQNAIDIGMLKKRGIKAPLYYYFRAKEKKLYAIADYIGCMSKANAEYVLNHNSEIMPSKVEICPNSIEIVERSVNADIRKKLREKYNIPQDRMIFVYGGNLGKPQGIDFLIRCLEREKSNTEVYFLIVGNGTEYIKLENYEKKANQNNLKLMRNLPKEDYDTLVAACDVGMIFLDHRFSIPNFPSRLLSYMQAKLPVLACTDTSTDIREAIIEGGFGWWCESNDPRGFSKQIHEILSADLRPMQERSFQYLCENYNVNLAYNRIVEH